MHGFGLITAIFPPSKNTVKKMNYGHRTGYNLLPTDAGGINRPDMVSIVHKAKGEYI